MPVDASVTRTSRGRAQPFEDEERRRHAERSKGEKGVAEQQGVLLVEGDEVVTKPAGGVEGALGVRAVVEEQRVEIAVVAGLGVDVAPAPGRPRPSTPPGRSRAAP